MKRVLVSVAALVAAWAGVASAMEESAIIVKKMAEAMSVNALCDRLELNVPQITLIVMSLGYDPEVLMPDVVAQGNGMTAKLTGMPEELICMTGDQLYGPNGTNAADWLIPK